MGEGVNPHPVTPNSVTPSPPHPGLRGARCTRFIPPAACRGGVDNVARGRGVEAGGLEGKLVLCPDLPSRRDRMPPQREPGPDSQTDT